jgi:hypothetical protein
MNFPLLNDKKRAQEFCGFPLRPAEFERISPLLFQLKQNYLAVNEKQRF